MKCRQCGAEIAEKALICYRCGTATTEPAFKPSSKPHPSTRVSVVIAVLVIALMGVVAAYAMREPGVHASQVVTAAGVWVAVVVVALRAYLRRR